MLKNIPKHLKIGLLIVIGLLFISGCNDLVSKSTSLFNITTDYKLSYDNICQEQISNYDGYYNTFIDKQSNANINKETFLMVTDIIMSRRADGKNVSWKWLQENQQIPYEEFTIFYKELSEFISERYADNMRIEREKQNIVKKHNRLLLLYPNNIYNIILSIKPLKYKAGYISNYTINKFQK